MLARKEEGECVHIHMCVVFQCVFFSVLFFSAYFPVQELKEILAHF